MRKCKSMKFLYSFLLITLGVGFSMIADVFLKKSNASNIKFLILGFIFYGLATVPVAFAFKFIQFGPVFLIWEAITVISALTIASLIFNESMTVYKSVALVFAIAAIFFAYK